MNYTEPVKNWKTKIFLVFPHFKFLSENIRTNKVFSKFPLKGDSLFYIIQNVLVSHFITVLG